MADVFFNRSTCAKHAIGRGFAAFRTSQPMPAVDPTCWVYHEQPTGPGINYAKQYAADHDWVAWCEVTDEKLPVLVVSCFRDELPVDIPKLFILEPTCFELWEHQDPACRAMLKHKAYRARPERPVSERQHIATGDVPAVSRSARVPGAKSIVKEVYLAMPGAPKADVIAACIARGVFKGTAQARYSDVVREIAT